MNQPSFPRGVGSDIRQWANRHRGGTAGTRRSSSAGCQPEWIEIIASDEHQKKIKDITHVSCKIRRTQLAANFASNRVQARDKLFYLQPW